MQFMTIAAVSGVLIPFALLYYFRKRDGTKVMTFLIGAAVFAIFAVYLEDMFHALVFRTPAGNFLQSNILIYALYAGAAAGLFEECGRYAAFRFVLRNDADDDHNALMYGAGHGGAEAIYVLTFGMVNNILTARMINSGEIASFLENLNGDDLAAATQAITTLAEADPRIFLIGIAERVFAIAAHIALSVLVWFAVQDKRNGYLFPTAIALHMLLDFVATYMSTASSVFLAEGAVALCSAALCFIAFMVWKKLHIEEEENEEGPDEDQDRRTETGT